MLMRGQALQNAAKPRSEWLGFVRSEGARLALVVLWRGCAC